MVGCLKVHPFAILTIDFTIALCRNSINQPPASQPYKPSPDSLQTA